MAPTYWHGGPAGLPIGSTLLPRAHLEHLPARDAALGGLVLAVADRRGEHDPAHVYVTTDRALAGHFAGHHAAWPAGGALYAVQPAGPLTQDPDFPTVGTRCPSATILSSTPATAWQDFHADKPYTTWQDRRSPIYAPDGHALPSPSAARLGVTAEDLHHLGPWPELNQINRASHAVILTLRPGMTHEDIARMNRRFQA